MAAPMNVSQASAYSPTSSTQKKRMVGRSNGRRRPRHHVAEEDADEHVDHGDEHEHGDRDVGHAAMTARETSARGS